MNRENKRFGNSSEDRAVEFLISSGFDIIERNFYARKMGEIDIVAIKDGIIHFIEVKSSRGGFNPIYNLTPSKLHKVINSSQYFMKIKKLNNPFCIDALIIRGKEMELIENITL